MEYTLKPYQTDAVLDVLANLRKAGRYWREDGDRSSFSLAATTGSGKTVIAAAVIEALFTGSGDYGVPPDPGAVVMWFSDDPSLNEQSRFRIEEATGSELRRDRDLVTVEYPFNREKFESGKVYFLNTQKLSKTSLLTRGYDAFEENARVGQDPLPEMRPDGQSYTIWDTIQNTIDDKTLTLYLVLDEAHRGMGGGRGPGTERSTIVQRLINGEGGVSPVPVVWGISATVERFNAAMKAASGRTALPNVVVDAARVQESGLLKDTVVLDVPGERGQFHTVLLRRGTDKLRALSEAWTAYTTAQSIPPVHPLMVFQLPNVPKDDEVAEWLSVIFERWPHLTVENVAHVLGDHTTQQYGPYEVPYVSPEHVQDSNWIRVLIAKDAISTGWDCPRAEVMVSFRPADDKTHITQLLGRMVRSPLARRVPGNDLLNSVDCLLPYFNPSTVAEVASSLMTGSDDDPALPGRRVLVDPQEFTPNGSVPEAAWEKLLSLPSQSLPQRAARPVQRLTALAHELAADGLLADAGKEAHHRLNLALDAASVQYAERVAHERAGVLDMDGLIVKVDMASRTKSFDEFVEEADMAVVDDAYNRAARVFGREVARRYTDHLAARYPTEPIEEALTSARTDIAALALVPEVKEYLDAQADKLANDWFTEFRVAIAGLRDERREAYRQIKALSAEPQDIGLVKPTVWTEATVVLEPNGDRHAVPTRPDHLMADGAGQFPFQPNALEAAVLDAERARPGFLAWYRNPARSSQDSLGIAYKAGDSYKLLRPDFIFFSTAADGTVAASIVDPHGHFLSDALPKLRGLAAYAEQFGSHFQRIEAVSKVGETLKVLDLTDPRVRAAVAAADEAEALYIDLASDYL